MTKHTFPSSSNPDKTYTVQVAEDGQASCDCPAWRFKKGDKPRTCKHVVAVAHRPSVMTVVREAQTEAETAAAELMDRLASRSDGMKGYVNPMLAQPLDARYPKREDELHRAYVKRVLDGEDWSGWWLEEKLDGHRVVVSVSEDHVVSAWSRPKAKAGGKGLPRTLPAHILAVLKAFPEGTYDGELIVPGGNSWDVVNLERQKDLVLVLFDTVRCDGKDLSATVAWTRRKHVDALGDTVKAFGVTAVRVAEIQPVSAGAVERIWAHKGEGAMLKQESSLYRPGMRSPQWLKVKKVETAVLTITGFEAGKLGPYARVRLRSDDGISTSVKTLNNEWLREFEKRGERYIGRKLRIEHQGIFTTKGIKNFRHPMFDHLIK